MLGILQAICSHNFISFAVNHDIMKNMVIPRYIKKLFWETDPERVDKEKHKDYIIARILDYGTPESIRWLLRSYRDEEILRVVKHRRGLSRKTAIFWAYRYNIPLEEVECLKNVYPGKVRPF